MAGIKQAREEFESEQQFKSNAQLVDEETEFCILSATWEDGNKFGPVWRLMIVYLDETGEHTLQSLFLSAGTIRNGTYKENSYRRWFFTKKATYPIHHAILIQGPAANGNHFNDIDDAPDPIEPCPCQTGDWINTASNTHFRKGAVVEADAAYVEISAPEGEHEREHYVNGISELSLKMGWPFMQEKIAEKDIATLRHMYKNLGQLAARQ